MKRLPGLARLPEKGSANIPSSSAFSIRAIIAPSPRRQVEVDISWAGALPHATSVANKARLVSYVTIPAGLVSYAAFDWILGAAASGATYITFNVGTRHDAGRGPVSTGLSRAATIAVTFYDAAPVTAVVNSGTGVAGGYSVHGPAGHEVKHFRFFVLETFIRHFDGIHLTTISLSSFRALSPSSLALAASPKTTSNTLWLILESCIRVILSAISSRRRPLHIPPWGCM